MPPEMPAASAPHAPVRRLFNKLTAKLVKKILYIITFAQKKIYLRTFLDLN